MPILTIDISRLRRTTLGALPASADVDRVLAGIGAASRQRWIKLAQSELRSTARDYVQGIQEVEIKGRVASISLVGVLPNMIERGWPKTDLRTTLLNSPKAKTAKDGSRYMAIPFRHGTPGSGGANVGRPMPDSIYGYAKKLAPTLSRPTMGGGMKAVLYGGRLEPRANMKAEARAVLTTKAKPWHSMSIYRGMIRQQKTYAKASQSSYTTFRMISTNVRNGKAHWIHPGIQARRLAEKVQADIGKMLGEFVATSMSTGGR